MNTFLVIMQNHWGRGSTINEAYKNCKSSGGKGKFMVYLTQDPKCYVDEFSYICTHSPNRGSQEIGRFTSATLAKWEDQS